MAHDGAILSTGPAVAAGRTTTVILRAAIVSLGPKDLVRADHQILRAHASQ